MGKVRTVAQMVDSVWKLVEEEAARGTEVITWNTLRGWFRRKKITTRFQPEVTARLRYKLRNSDLKISIRYSDQPVPEEEKSNFLRYVERQERLYFRRKSGRAHSYTDEDEESVLHVARSVRDVGKEHFDLIRNLGLEFLGYHIDPGDIFIRLEDAIREAAEQYSWQKPYAFEDWVWWFAVQKIHKLIQRRMRKAKAAAKASSRSSKKKAVETIHVSPADLEHFKQVFSARGKVTREDIEAYYPELTDADWEYISSELEEAGVQVEGDESSLFTEVRTYSRAKNPMELVQNYLQEIGQVNLLTADQEKALARKIEMYKMMLAKKSALEKMERGEELTEEEKKAIEELGTEPVDEWELEALKEEAEYAWERLIVANLRLVVSIAKKYTGRGMDFMDLVQEGTLGLMKAVEKFEWRRGYKFSTYATWWIRQAITRALADQSRTIRIPVHMVETKNRYMKVRQQLYHELGREPTISEIAKAMGVPEEKVREIETTIQEPKSLEATVGDQDDTHFGDFIEDPNVEKPEEYVARRELKEAIRQILDELPEREREVVKLYYGLDDGIERSLDQVGERFGITRERVRQILQKAMKKLRSPTRIGKLKKLLNQ